MKRLAVFALSLTLVSHSAVLAAGPVEESGKRAARQLAQAQGQSSNKKKLLWTGGALIGAGVALITFLEKSDRGDPQGELPLVFLGLGMTGAGAAMMIVGAFKSTSIQIRPNGVAYRVRF